MVKYSDELTAAIAKRRKEKAKAKPPVAPPRLRRGLKKPKGTHKMPDGTVMSGKTHSKDSKPVKKAKAPAKPKVPKKLVKPNVMKRIQKKVAKLGKDKVKEKVKVGKAIDKVAKKMGKEKAKAKAKAKAPPKKKPKFKVVKKEQPKKLVKPEVMKRIQEKVAKLGKDKVKEKKTVGEKIEKKIKPQGQKLTGLSKAEMNSMSPEKLFGMLPSQLSSGVVLNPKRTGVKVAQDPAKAYEAFIKEGEARMEGMGGKIEELKLKYMEDFKAQKLKVPALKVLMREANFGGGYNKGEMIERLALVRAEKETGYKELGDQLYSARSRERSRLAKAEADKVQREIQEARKNPKKPSEKEIGEFGLDMVRHSAAMRQMRGSAYAGSREASKKRLQHRYRNIFAYREKFGSEYIDSVIGKLGTPRGYEFQ